MPLPKGRKWENPPKGIEEDYEQKVRERRERGKRKARERARLANGEGGAEGLNDEALGRAGGYESDDEDQEGFGPWITGPVEITGEDEIPLRKCRTWTKSRGNMSTPRGSNTHINALAYISDSYFVGTIPRIHQIWRWPFEPSQISQLPPAVKSRVLDTLRKEGIGSQQQKELQLIASASGKPVPPAIDKEVEEFWKSRPQLGMMVSLDHSIYFHQPRRIKADDWLFSEMESWWAGDGRGVVVQRIWGKGEGDGDGGTLLATCVQEGVVRLRRVDEVLEEEEGKKKAAGKEGKAKL